MVPAVVDKLVKLGAEVRMQSGAGDDVSLPDSAYRNVTMVADVPALVGDADVVLAVQPPSLDAVTGDEGRGGAPLVRARPPRARAREAAPGPADHLLRDGAGAPDHAGAGDGRPVEPGRARRVLRRAAGRHGPSPHPAAHDDGDRRVAAGDRAGDGAGRGGPAVDRDGAAARRGGRGVRRAAGDARGGGLARREVRRHRRGRPG